MKLTLLTIGKMHGAYADLAQDYIKRLTLPFALKELTAPTQKAEGEVILKNIPKGATIILMDERGKDIDSIAFASQMQKWQDDGVRDLVFVIGGADGHTDAVRAQASFSLGLGRKTWPHMLARVMLIEQIYRAQQINAGHPHHRA